MNIVRIMSIPAVIFLLVIAMMSIAVALLGIPVTRVTEIAIYALYGAGINLLLAYTGLMPFGAAIFFGLSAYASALFAIRFGGSELAGLAVAVGFSGLIGIPIGLIVLRRGGIYFALLTLAFSQLAYEVVFKWTSLTGGENGLQSVPRPLFQTPWAFHAFVSVTVALCLYLLWRIAHSPTGRVLQAIRDNEQRSKVLGYDTFRYKLTGFVLMACFVGYAGGLLTFLLQGAYANPLGWQHAADPILMTVFGGVHHFLGPLWGAITFVVLQDRLSAIFENWWLLFAPIIMAFALLAPEGLHGFVQQIFGRAHWSLMRQGIPPRPAAIAPFATKVGLVEDGKPILTVRGLSKRFGSLVTARNIDLDVMPGRLHSLIGPNGAGKTTFFNMLTGMITPNAGTITFLGSDVTHLPVHERVRLGLARSFQIISLFQHLTVFESVRIAVQAHSAKRFGLWSDAHALQDVNDRTWSLLDAVGLADRAAELSTALSHGEQRMLDIAVTLAADASLLLLDEPLAGLSEADRKVVAALVRKLANTHAVLLIEHDIDRVLQISDHLTVLHQGRLIADGPPREVARHPDVIAAYLGTYKLAGEAECVSTSTAASVRRGGRSAIPLLSVEDISAGYAGSRVLDGLSLSINAGEVVALLGRNGVGKSTTLGAITGTVPVSTGRIIFDGSEITSMQPYRINQAGIALVPEGRRLFPNLTVWENLRIAQRIGGASIEEAYELFPKLKVLTAAQASRLSGGERQMLAIARSLMSPSKLILLDEPFEGLAPVVVSEVMQAVEKLRERASVLIVEHNADLVLSIADRAYALVNGRVAFAGAAAELARDRQLQARLLGVTREEEETTPG